ncbi:MAG TPA: hypothetical protein VF797_21155 [Noviherbaspirillum sp.]
MAVNIDSIKTARAEKSPESAEAGQPASPTRPSRIVMRSTSERKPGLLALPGNRLVNQRNANAPGSPGNRTVEQAGDELSSQSRPASPLPTKLVRRINRLAGDDNDRGNRSLLRLHGDDAVLGNDPLAPLNIEWMISVEEPVAPGELGRATPLPDCTWLVAGSPPSLSGSTAAEQQKKRLLTAAEAFFHYPGPGDGAQSFAQWLQAHPLHRMFRQVYPTNDAISPLKQDIRTPMHTVLEAGISDPMRFHHSLMQISEQTDSRFTKPEALFRGAVAVSNHADGLLKKQADFFSRFFSVLIALETVSAPDEKAGIIETLRREWLETDFGSLLDRPDTSPLQTHWQAAEPARTQVSGRRTFSDAMGRSDMSPRKKPKTVHHQAASTHATDAHQASAPLTPDSPRHASPRTHDADSDADLPPSPDKDRSPVRSRSLSWKTSTLKRKPKLKEREFKAWTANLSASGVGTSSVRKPQSPVRQDADPPVSGITVTPAKSQEKPLTD